jgi:HK97 family phage major capsid protein
MLKELREKYAKAVADAKAVMSNAETEARSLTTEDETRFDAFMNEADSLSAQIKRYERLGNLDESRGRMTRDSETRTVGYDADDALRGWLLTGSHVAPTAQQASAMAAAGLNTNLFTFNLRKDALRSRNDVERWESRAQSHTNTAGGYLVAPDFTREVELAMLSFGGMREVASVVRTATGADLPWPTSDDTSNEGEIIGENTEVTAQDLVFGSKTLKAFKYSSKIVKVSTELLQDSAVNLGEVIGSRLGERIARIGNRHFTVGAGTTEPFGMVTGATSGGTSAAPTAITYDELVGLLHSVDASYRANGTWMFNDTTLAALRKVRDNDDKLIWQQGMIVGQPETILGRPFVVNNNVASIGASAKPILFGDMSKYKIRDVQEVSVLRLNDRFAEFGQVAFLAFSRHDGVLIDAGTHPVKYLTMHA